MSNKIRIESDGTSAGTVLYVDDKLVGDLEVIKFESTSKKTLTKLTLTYVYPDIEKVKDEK